MKRRMIGTVSLCVLLISYFAFRHPLFTWHGMKEFPFDLLLVGILVIVISGIIKCNRILPVCTAAGYITGFFCGYLFATTSYDPGGGTLNNMWLIWMATYGIAMIAGVLIEILHAKKHKAR